MASTRIYRTTGTPTLNTKHTISMWLKRSKLTYGDCFLIDGYKDGNNRFKLNFDSSDRLELYNTDGGSYVYNFRTNRVFRDTAAWYHLVIRVDTTQSTTADRVRIYVNGVQETSLATNTQPSQNDATNVINESGTTLSIGDYQGGSNAFDGLMTHVHFVDGTSYAPTTFGETDTTSGIWKPKTAPSVTYGNNGFFLKFENSAAMGTDSSGNTNTFTVSGTMTQNVDTPTNVFATLNKLSTHGNNTLSNGNLKIAFTANTSYTNSIGNLGINSGRWYVEAKIAGATTYYPCIGFCSMQNSTRKYYDPLYTAAHLGADEGTGYFAHGNIQKNGSTDGDYATFTTGDIISMYLDLESGTKTLKYYKNDSLIRSTTITPVDGQFYTFGATGTSSSDIVDFNFGSGFFGTTQVTTANADANGYGAFEYSPTIGGVDYYALCTKNIKEFG